MEISRSATLTRQDNWEDQPDPQGTFGQYISDRNFGCKIGELPWRENAHGISCIPKGRYPVLWQWSNKHKCNCYHITQVQDRNNVEIHKGNICGDVSKGYGSDVEGCQLPGIAVAKFTKGSIHPNPAKPPVDQLGVTESGLALGALEKDMRNDKGEQMPFYLEIK